MVDTSPWDPKVARLPSTAMTVTYGASVSLPDGTEEFLRPISGSTISFDAKRTPRVQATIVCAWPRGGTLAHLDPRLGNRINISAGYVFISTGLSDRHMMAQLVITDLVKDTIAQTVTITGSSDEIVPTSYPCDQTYSFASTSKVTAIQSMISDCFAVAPVWADIAVADSFNTTVAVAVGEDRWDRITDFADTMQAKVWHDGLGKWHMDVLPSLPAAKTSAALGVGHHGTLSALTISDTRSGYANRVLIRYTYTVGSTQHVDCGIAKTSLKPPSLAVIDRPFPPVDAGRAAHNTLRRMLRRGHQVDVTSSAYLWVRPTQTVTVNVPGGGVERVLVESVSFDLDAGQMTVSGQSFSPTPNTTITTSTTATTP